MLGLARETSVLARPVGSTDGRERVCQRRTYASVYLVVRDVAPFVLCDERDMLVKAWTDWDAAIRAAVAFRGWVTNFEEFRGRNMLLRMDEPRPAAVRILHVDRKGNARSFRAEFDASPEELKGLNIMTPRDFEHTPELTRALRSTARVWEE